MENRVAIETDPSRGTKAPQSCEANSLGHDAGQEAGHEAGHEAGEAAWTALIARAKTGDRVALDQLLASARPRLLSVAIRIVRNRDDAEDVVQEALLKVCRNLTRFEGRSAVSTWMHRIVANAALDCLRRKHARYERAPGGEAEPGDDRPAAPEAIDEETPERLVARAETGAVVRGVMASLSLVHREALALRELEGESYQDIARAARVPVGTVMSRLHHARRRFTSELAGGFDVGTLCAA